MMKSCIYVLMSFMNAFVCFAQNQVKIHRLVYEGLTAYLIDYSTIDMAFGEIPEQDTTVLFCAAASFTGQKLGVNFKHINIADDHVGGGVYHKGYPCRANTGYFAYYPTSKRWLFSLKENKNVNLVDSAVVHKGMCFGQAMVVFDGEIFTNVYEKIEKSINSYRVLAEWNNRLWIIESERMPFVRFRDKLKQIGVVNAIYMDMGRGWNYSFYRNDYNEKIYIHSEKELSSTNWIVFYR